MKGIVARTVVLAGLLMWLLVQAGCTPGPEIDKSILTDIPCTPPCWQQILPGQTTQDEAMAALSQSPYVQQDSIRKWYETVDDNTISWFSNADSIYGNSLQIHNDTVVYIDVTLDFRMPLGQLIDKYGSPDKVVTMPLIEEGKIRIFLFYLRQGFGAILLDFDSRKPVELSKNTIIKRIFYHPPTSTVEELQRDILKNPENVVNFYVRRSFDWIGYGSVKIMYP